MHFALADYDTLVFDCDGVILDSNALKNAAFATVSAPFGASCSAAFVAYHQRHGGISRNEKFAWLLDVLLVVPAADRERLLEKLLRDYAAICARELLRCPLIPGVAALLAALPDRAAAHVVTGGAEDEVRAVFRARELDRYFVSILGSPTPKRDNMHALARAGAFGGRSVYFGDAELDMQLAGEFGLDFIYVHGASDWHDGPRQCADRQIADFRDLGFHDQR
jgi:phosphoglycolate phosphatase-like HAD superfamily hydrolase